MPIANVPSAGAVATFRWWYLPSWLGLDAPCVVLTWTWAISLSSGQSLAFRPAVAMFLVVWSIYLADRLIDVARCRDWTQATGRLKFGRRHGKWFLACLSFCVIAQIALLIEGLPTEVLRRAILVALGVGLYYLLFVLPVAHKQKLPGKEFGVGLFFALGAFACLGADSSMIPLLASVASLVAYNCLVIAAKDAESDRANDLGAASRWWRSLQRDLLWCGIVMSLVGLVLAASLSQKCFYLSIATSFFLLTALHWRCSRFRGDEVRSLADFALFTPIPVFGIGNLIPIS